MEKDENFRKSVQCICDLYKQAIELYSNGVYVISTDEKTGIQAIERVHKTHRASPGKVELVEYEYKRHGTLCLIANFEVATGRIISPSIGPTRKEEDFARHIAQTVDLNPTAQWIFVSDQLNTHQSESLVLLVADRCRIEEDLGIKEKSGILKSMKTRAEFLSDESHRIRFVYTPKHTSWLNQVEIWFSILVKRLLKRASFKSLAELHQRLVRFIDFFNATMAKAFKWTYTGRPLTV